MTPRSENELTTHSARGYAAKPMGSHLMTLARQLLARQRRSLRADVIL